MVGEEPRNITIGFFGASIIEGYLDGGRQFRPLTISFAQNTPSYWIIHNFGKSGEKACDMASRFRCVLENYKLDWIFVLGGTNDVTSGAHGEKIYACLLKLYELANSKKVKVVRMTIPEIDWKTWYSLRMEENRSLCNERLVSSNSNDLLFDLNSYFPQRTLSSKEKEQFWNNDGVHPSEKGYGRIGVLLAEWFKTELKK